MVISRLFIITLIFGFDKEKSFFISKVGYFQIIAPKYISFTKLCDDIKGAALDCKLLQFLTHPKRPKNFTLINSAATSFCLSKVLK